MPSHSLRWLPAVVACLAALPLHAEVALPHVFSDHMVLQRSMPCPIWGTADAGEQVTVSFAGQTKTTTAGDDGRWRVALDPLEAPGGGTLTVKGSNEVAVRDVAVGEVWICSGQSNMGFSVARAFNASLNIAAGNQPDIRLMTINPIGEQTPCDDFLGEWEAASPEVVRDFSAVGYLFGKRLQEILGVPVGLIDNAWGGSSCEAWIAQDKLSDKELYAPLIKRWKDLEAKSDEAALRTAYSKKYEAWKKKALAAKAAGKRMGLPPGTRERLLSQQRPGNLYNARTVPIAGFAIRGAIWYQGESNAGRAYQYREMFPLMIQSWRDAWGQGDFPFYWVQLADFRKQADGPEESPWAELREAQTMTLDRLPNTGQAVIIDIGDASDIHPRNKQEVADRLARIALAKDYGRKMPHESPRYKSMEIKDGKVVVTLAKAGRGIKNLDARQVQGFTIAGTDKQWHAAKAKVLGRNKVQVWSDAVPEPVAVRYAWAENPICNLYSRAGLPVTPFRTDDWPGVTAGKR